MLSANGYSHFGQTSKRLASRRSCNDVRPHARYAGLIAANITVASPVNGTTVASPIWVRAHNVDVMV